MAVATNQVNSMENLVPEEMYRKSKHSRMLLISALVVACVIAITMTCLFVWKISETANTSVTGNYAKTIQTSNDAKICPEYPNSLPTLPAPLPKQIQSVIDKMSNYLEELVSTNDLPAISANIYYKDSIIWTGHYGKKTIGGERPDNNTRYRIGSISKVFPVLMVYMLYERGVISSLDDPLSKYAPDFVINNPFTRENITLRQIINQQAGLPREAPCVLCINNQTTAEQLLYLKNQSLVIEPGTVPSYSNLGYALLARLLTERLTNKTFEDWTKDNILSPLGFKHTGFTINNDVKKNMAFPYDAQGRITPFMDIGWLSPSGQMYSTAEEMAQFGMFLMSSTKHNKVGLNQRSLKEILTPSHIAPDGRTVWGSPWEIFLREHFLLRTKGGSIDDMSAMMAIIPEIKLGFNVFFSTVSNFSAGAFISNYAVDKFAKELIPVFNQTLFELNENGSFPTDSKPYTGTYNITAVNIYSPSSKVQHYQATITQQGVSLIYKKTAKHTGVSLYYIEEKLILQGRMLGQQCFLQRMGSIMAFYFKPFSAGELSPGFVVPHLGITALRVN